MQEGETQTKMICLVTCTREVSLCAECVVLEYEAVNAVDDEMR
jgi:hypothetical protein